MNHLFTRPLLTVIGGFSIFFSSFGFAQKASQSNEYNIKAGYLLKFGAYVEWPDLAEDAPLVIGVLGKGPLGERLTLIDGEVHSGRLFQIKKLGEWKSGLQIDCLILFIDLSQKPYLSEILDSIRGQPILTVGEVDDFAEEDGIINFYQADNRIRYQVNLDNASKHNIRLRSPILRYASWVIRNNRKKHNRK